MSISESKNVALCKDCSANNVETPVLWIDNPDRPGKRMPIEYVLLTQTGEKKRHNCPFWKKGGGTTTPQQRVEITDSTWTNKPPQRPAGQTTLPPNEKVFTDLTDMLTYVRDELVELNSYLKILAEKKVGLQSALSLKSSTKEEDGDPFAGDGVIE